MVLDGNEDTFMRIAVKHNMWIILELPHIVKPSLIQVRNVLCESVPFRVPGALSYTF
jgi:hypothetical protein